MGALSMSQALAKRDAGIQSATEHAESEVFGWSDHAYTYLSWHAQRVMVPFTAEDVRLASVFRGVASPPDQRAWGGIFKSAIANGVIVKVGYAPTISSNGSVRALYLAKRFAP